LVRVKVRVIYLLGFKPGFVLEGICLRVKVRDIFMVRVVREHTPTVAKGRQYTCASIVLHLEESPHTHSHTQRYLPPFLCSTTTLKVTYVNGDGFAVSVCGGGGGGGASEPNNANDSGLDGSGSGSGSDRVSTTAATATTSTSTTTTLATTLPVPTYDPATGACTGATTRVEYTMVWDASKLVRFAVKLTMVRCPISDGIMHARGLHCYTWDWCRSECTTTALLHLGLVSQ
jgi:hypothetical protein